MGSGQSARKLTVTNEDEIGVIKVSNSLVQRIAQREKAKASEEAASDARTPTTPAEYSPAPPATTFVPPATPNSTPGHPVYYYPELTMSAHQIQQQKEQELKQQEQYWRRRLQNVDDSYQKINRILTEEYQKTLAETSPATAGQSTAGIQSTVQPCIENSSKVLKCFQSHPKETLACSSLVEEFSNCVWNVHYTHAIKARS
ncbi:PREDICTED: uncharacterized protein LOC106742193 [Dinoponera quadriceps]|uniref:Uncharacterized protein LOC106742193 n=1 Tax=Dinoponera quadriceps TaxID=609295 RepID=A0A6P3WWC1_DINQU|nr:PREDICTED: uncharacterized protein LOC106742193 [Dinoponera quadriceps]XP_014470400.1 PREDICTED: uncharacterized protein LOC106742193 [Dinoponera quadriceps]XP_014470401.1 PREDICTED: uncharacterized protein LOC106742193 [Dinoponera quadriceps]